MNGAGLSAFCQLECTVFRIRETCARQHRPELPDLFHAWGARARVLTAASATGNKGNPKQESWRIPRVIPDMGNFGAPAHQPAAPDTPAAPNPGTANVVTANTVIPTRPSVAPPPPPYDPTLRPTLERVLFPWEAPLSAIEWAVSNYLAKEHPEIFRRVLNVALKHDGLIDPDFDLDGDPHAPSVTQKDDKGVAL